MKDKDLLEKEFSSVNLSNMKRHDSFLLNQICEMRLEPLR